MPWVVKPVTVIWEYDEGKDAYIIFGGKIIQGLTPKV
jgi:hypothetical protein